LEFRKTALFFSLPKQAALTFWLRAPRVSENTLDEHFLQRISARFDGLICCLFLSLFPRFFAEGIHHVICERARVFLIRPHATFGSNYLANNVGDKLSFDQYLNLDSWKTNSQRRRLLPSRMVLEEKTQLLLHASML
jgi:hypothetical protein